MVLTIINSLEVKQMSDFSELPEYTRDTYLSFGKKYNNEIGVISLTSWTARINTVAKTLFSLVQQCPNFHIVLVLAEEEFPKMTAELPENLMLFVENELIELMFVRKNYRSFKKVLFTMDKYRDVPVISADDDCIYTCNYAQELYDKWVSEKKHIISFRKSKKSPGCPVGCSVLYSPKTFSTLIFEFKKFKIKNNQDDGFFWVMYKKYKWSFLALHNNFPCVFHDQIKPINGV